MMTYFSVERNYSLAGDMKQDGRDEKHFAMDIESKA
jgi:hypothetical protein